MKKTVLLAASLAATLGTAAARNTNEPDTLRTIQMEEMVIVATPKENRNLHELPIASSRLTQ